MNNPNQLQKEQKSVLPKDAQEIISALEALLTLTVGLQRKMMDEMSPSQPDPHPSKASVENSRTKSITNGIVNGG